MIIDIFSHHITGRVHRFLEKSNVSGNVKSIHYPTQNANPEARLAVMEKYGVDMQVLTQTTPILVGLGDQDAAEICRLSNEDNYSLCKAYPRNFVNVCVISLLNMKSAMDELERCIQEFDCRGVIVSSNQNGKGLDSTDYYPLYEKLVEYDLPIWIHPTHWESYPLVDSDTGWRMMDTFGWPFDTTQAVWRLILGGVLDRFPTLKVITHHLGAMIPYFSRRVETTLEDSYRGQIKHPIREYWKNIYGDTAVSGTKAAFACGHAFFGSERMMYGTDYPMGPDDGEDFIRENMAGVEELAIPEEDKKKILGGNAQKILKIQ